MTEPPGDDETTQRIEPLPSADPVDPFAAGQTDPWQAGPAQPDPAPEHAAWLLGGDEPTSGVPTQPVSGMPAESVSGIPTQPVSGMPSQPVSGMPAEAQPVSVAPAGPPAGSPHRVIMAVAITVSVIAAIGVLVTLGWIFVPRGGDDTVATRTPGQDTSARAASAGAASPAASPAASAAPSASDETTGTDETPIADPPAIVDWSPVKQYPNGKVAALIVGTYMTAVNEQDYERAYSMYSPVYQDRLDYAEWANGIKSTKHSGVRLISVTDGAEGVTANVLFTSNQLPGHGPAGRENETCTRWDLNYRLVRSANPGYPMLIDSAAGISSTPC